LLQLHKTTVLFFISACLAAVSASAQAPTIGSCNILPADNIWNTRIDQLPVSGSSATWVNTIGPSALMHPDFGSGTWNGEPIGIPFTTVPGTQTKYPAAFTYAAESDPGPYAIPLDIPIQGGSQSTGDRHAIALDTTNCILYELFYSFPQASGWKADSGAIFNLSSNALRPASWTSADAAGFPILPGLVRYDEIVAGEIRHAISFTVSQSQMAYIWPARHFASPLTDPKYPPMGARFRLKANFDISGFSPTNQIILRALKKYGIMLADNGAPWFISGVPDERWDNSDLHNLTTVTGSDFEAVDASSLMVDPSSGQARQAGVSVSVTPSSAAVNVNSTTQFTATVQNSSDPTVSWSVNGVPGGNASSGSISGSGLYIAPAAVPSPSTIIVEAKSNSMPSAFGTASVTVTAPVAVTLRVSPSRATVRTGRTQAFTATVQGTTNQAVLWKVNGVAGGNSTVGTISSTGLYTAPQSVPSRSSVTVTAVSVAAPAVSAQALIAITRR
jgi:hypothetical protein